MLKRLSLTNFQSWASLDLELSPVVVIVGETDCGKSAILRAISAVLFNALEGTSFVRKGHSRTSVAVETEDHTVTWHKGTAVNQYTVDGLVLDKIGREVPSVVAEALGVTEVVFEEGGTLTLQFQPQMDAPFLLTDQGVRATRLLGSVSKVASLYKAARSAASRHKTAESEFRLSVGAVEQCQTRLSRYEGFAELADPAVQLQVLLAAQQNAQEVAKRSHECVAAYREAKLRSEKTVVLNRALWDKARVLERKVNVLELYENVREAQQIIGESKMKSESLRGREIQLGLQVTIVGDRLAKLERMEAVKQQQVCIERFIGVRKRLADITMLAAEARARVTEHGETVKTLERELTCPTCGRESV